MKYNELIQFSIFSIICFFLLRHSYLREKSEKYNKKSDYASIKSASRVAGLSLLFFISLILIIIKIIEIIN